MIKKFILDTFFKEEVKAITYGIEKALYDILQEKVKEEEEVGKILSDVKKLQQKLDKKEKVLQEKERYLEEKSFDLAIFGGVERMKAYYFFARLLDGEDPTILMNQIESMKPQEQSLEKFFEENPDMGIVYKALSSARDL